MLAWQEGEPMVDPNIVLSGLSRTLHVGQEQYRIDIYRLEDEVEWTLEAIDREGTSTVWDNRFETDQAALEEVLKCIREEGAAAFRELAESIPFRKR
jgi:hypothetical protein